MERRTNKLLLGVRSRLVPLSVAQRIARRRWNNPYQPHQDRDRFVFVHIPKNAGRSVQDSLFPGAPYVGHKPALVYKVYDPDKFKRYFKFTLVRNPWARLLSAYAFVKQGGLDRAESSLIAWRDAYHDQLADFETFVSALADRRFAREVLRLQHFAPQHGYVCDERGRLACDYVGCVETFRESLTHIGEELGIEPAFQWSNKSTHGDYRSAYSDRTSEIAAWLYRDDIRLFDYDFD